MKLKTKPANHFELACRSIRVTYSSTSFGGGPLFHYRDPILNRSFFGDEIRLEKTPIGQLVTVTVEEVPDLRTVLFTLVLPVVKVLEGGPATSIEVPGIRTTVHFTIGGPPELGPDKTYEVCDLTGNAQFFVF